MLKKKIEKALNHQIKIELESSQFYLAMASWAETKGLNGTAMFLYEHADEERMHMMKLVRFVNERGGQAVIPAIAAPAKDYKSINKVFEQWLYGYAPGIRRNKNL